MHGNFHLEKKGALTGPGVIAAIGHIQIKKDSTIGSGITLIAGKHIEIKEKVISGTDNTFYATDKIQIKKNVQIEGSIIGLSKIEVKEGATIVHDCSLIPILTGWE